MLPVMERPHTRENLARNLRFLMTQDRHSQQALAKLSKVSQKTVSNMLNPDGPTPTLESVDSVAGVYGLTGWQLILPSVPAERTSVQALVKLVDDYAAASETGQAAISRVAEMEAAYTKKTP